MNIKKKKRYNKHMSRTARKIKNMIDYYEFEDCCNSTIEQITEGYENPALGLYYKNQGSDILAVAHLDSVCKPSHFVLVQIPNKGDIVFSPVLDDRAGVYIITKLLPSLGINMDILLTEDEEIGASTAYFFNSSKEYKWGVEFDREHDDVVLYDYEYNNPQWVQAIKESKFKIGIGTFSDISYLEHLGCSFLNIGTGLVRGHSEYAHIIVDDLVYNVEKFINFYNKYKDTKFPYSMPNYETPGHDLSWFLPKEYWHNKTTKHYRKAEPTDLPFLTLETEDDELWKVY